MSALRERLRAALQQPVRAEGAVRVESVTELPDLAGLGGRWFESPQGPGYVIESVYEGGHCHGEMPLHRALTLDTQRLAEQCRDERLAECDPAEFLYFDTETTGLGGAGTMVFLAGAAMFDGGTLRLKQYLLPGPQYEGGLLGGIADDLDAAAALVSYNGKSFDVPAMETRYILSRMTPGLRGLPHVDLLHPNRRLFKGFDSHRLPRMEVELLGFEREADCPSAEVPERYFRFQRTGDPTWIQPVLRHNAWDILSLVALAGHLAAVCAGEAGPVESARAAAYAGEWEGAVGQWLRVVETTGSRSERLEALEGLARGCSKLERYEDAAGWWRALIEEPRARRITPYVELAKVLEHRLRRPGEALATVEQALARVRRGVMRQGPSGGEANVAALEHRRLRLVRKANGARKA